MKAIVMAAGKGSRISDKIDGIPKSTLKLDNGEPIIRRQIKIMLDKGINTIVCAGYKKELIMEALKGLNVKFYFNPFFSITNNIVSLWFALNEFDGEEDIILTSADLYYPAIFLDKIKEMESNLAMIVDSTRIDSGDFYFSVDNGIIEDYGPKVPQALRDFEYMGITAIKKEYVPIVKESISQYINNEKFDRYFEDMIISLNQNEKENIDFIDVQGEFWREFDFYSDYEVILQHERENKQ